MKTNLASNFWLARLHGQQDRCRWPLKRKNKGNSFCMQRFREYRRDNLTTLSVLMCFVIGMHPMVRLSSCLHNKILNIRIIPRPRTTWSYLLQPIILLLRNKRLILFRDMVININIKLNVLFCTFRGNFHGRQPVKSSENCSITTFIRIHCFFGLIDVTMQYSMASYLKIF